MATCKPCLKEHFRVIFPRDVIVRECFAQSHKFRGWNCADFMNVAPQNAPA